MIQLIAESCSNSLKSRAIKIALVCAALLWPLSDGHVRAETATLATPQNASDLMAKLVQIAMLIQSSEQAALDSETRLDELKLRRRSMMARFDRQRGELSQLLSALQRLGRQPPSLLLVRAEAAVDHVRGATLLGAVVKSVEKEAAVLREDLVEIDRLESGMTKERQGLLGVLENLRAEQAQLSALLAEQKDQNPDLIASAAEKSEEMAALAKKSKDADDLLARLESPAPAVLSETLVPRGKPQALAESQAPVIDPDPGQEVALLQVEPPAANPKPALISVAKGRLSIPARGKIVADFGAKDGSGTSRRGLSIRTREAAEIIAPFDGKIVFAGPFRAYGQLLILEAGEGYHILLSGMSQVHGVIGQSVAQGQPVGRMGTGPKSDGQAGLDQGSDLRDLYVEFRKDGKPFNPMPWLESNAKKVSG